MTVIGVAPELGMRMTLLSLVVVAIVLGGVRSVSATGCVWCAFLPSDATCVPNGGILSFNSVAPNVPAYWDLFARKRGLRSVGRLSGRLTAWSDARDPGVPGFPGRRWGDVFRGRTARFKGTVVGHRLEGDARYTGGVRCMFTGTHGILQVQVIRLSGCRS
jgi:hypothetical protein